MKIPISRIHRSRLLPAGVRSRLAVLLLLGLSHGFWLTGCGEYKTDVSGCESYNPYGPPAWPGSGSTGGSQWASRHHVAPAWSQLGGIVYHDYGFVCDSVGAYATDATLVGLYVIDPNTGTKRRLAPGGFSPSWSADGSRVAFEDSGAIYSVAPDGTDSRLLVAEGHDPAYSPDGTRLAWEHDRHIFVGAADGSNPTQLPDSGYFEYTPSWSSDGLSVVTEGESRTPPVSWSILRHRVQDGDLRVLRRGYGGYPKLSPDGKLIAYFSSEGSGGVLVAPADSPQVAARLVVASSGTGHSWSPDGTEIVLTGGSARQPRSSGNGVLWIVNVQTGAQRQLTSKWPSRCK